MQIFPINNNFHIQTLDPGRKQVKRLRAQPVERRE